MNSDPLARLHRPLADEAATHALAARLARGVVPGVHLHLHGDLGAGKTTFVRGLLRALGHTGPVRSPTYALVESYVLQPCGLSISTGSSLYFQHFDFYRFNRDTDWLDAGFRDLLASDAVCAIEWPERAGDLLPAPDLDVRLDYVDAGRVATLDALTPTGAACLAALAPPDPPTTASTTAATPR